MYPNRCGPAVVLGTGPVRPGAGPQHDQPTQAAETVFSENIPPAIRESRKAMHPGGIRFLWLGKYIVAQVIELFHSENKWTLSLCPLASEYQTAMGLFAVPSDKDKRIPKLECWTIIGNLQDTYRVDDILFVVYTKRVAVDENKGFKEVIRLISARLAANFEIAIKQKSQ